jgi:predicted DNA-binding WGR domain protein
MRSQPLPNLLAAPYVFHRLEPVTERLATEQLPAVLDADLKTWYLNRTATILAPHRLECYRRQVKEALTTQGLDTSALERNLFGEWSLVRMWGRIGQTRQTRITLCADLPTTQNAYARKLLEKRRRDYA